MHDKFEKFTPGARKVLSFAQEEAQCFNHNYVGTEHLLLGLLREANSTAPNVLVQLGVDLNRVRAAVEFLIGRGDQTVLGEIGLTPRAKKTIELAVDEAWRLNHHYIGTEHLLLGLAREGEGIAARVLESLGVTLEQVRAQTMQVLGLSGPSQATESPSQASPPGSSFTFAPRANVSVSFGGLTEGARHVLLLAHAEAQHLYQDVTDDEHILLGLVLEGNSSAARALDRHGATIFAVRRALDNTRHVDHVLPGLMGLTSRAEAALTNARSEATRHSAPLVMPEHLLLGLLTLPQGAAITALRHLGIDPDALYAELPQPMRDDRQTDQPPEE